MLRTLSILMLLAATSLAAGEALLKPMAGPGAGDLVDGLRASVSVMKNEYGPGESVMVTFKLSNESDKSAVVKLGKNHVYDFSLEARKDGKDLNIKRVDFTDFFSPNISLQPGESTTKVFDLRDIHMTDGKWADEKARYEFRLCYLPKNMKTGWAKFSITEPGENPPELDPELAEQVRTMIARLGDENAATRDKAYADLLALGTKILRPLQEVANTHAGDVSTRCQNLIDEIKRRAAPPPPVIIRPQPRPQPRPNPNPNPLPDPPPDEF